MRKVSKELTKGEGGHRGVGGVGEMRGIWGEGLGRWVEGASEILKAFGGSRAEQAKLLRDLMQVWLIVSAGEEAKGGGLRGVLSHVGEEGRRRLLEEGGLGGLALRERVLAHLAKGDDAFLGEGLLASTGAAVALIESLRDLGESQAGGG